ncbi:MAG TPA: hypothetical protein VLJ17_15380, partial [Xanthobacteraceae bacterium]|nr:hypothetical protein [Xanthobacteraceae bacterium]
TVNNALMSSGIRNTSGARIQISLCPQSLARVSKKSSARCCHLKLDLIIRLMTTCGVHADFIFIWFFLFAHKGQTAMTLRIPDSRAVCQDQDRGSRLKRKGRSC